MGKLKWLILLCMLFLMAGCSPKYRISFNTMGGQPIDPILNVKKNDKVLLPIPMKEGHQFVGWYQDLLHTIPFTDENEVNENLTLYAKWESKSYRIVFDANSEVVVGPIEVIYGEIINEPTPTKKGYNFLGWYLNKELTKKFDYTHMPAVNLKLYAKWEPINYLMTYETNGGESLPSVNYHYEDELNIPDPIRSGYLFLGWYQNSNLTAPFTLEKMPDQNVTIYAKWEQLEYTVRWVIDENQVVENVHLIGDELVPPIVNKIGYKFIGWYYDAEHLNQFDLTTCPAQDLTIYAGWEISQYKITFISDDEVYYETTLNYQAPIDLDDPEKEGHTFLGWYADLNQTIIFDMVVPAMDMEVYANWSRNKYWVIFHENFGWDAPDFSDYYQNEFELPSISKEGYIFNGWYTDEELTLPFFGDPKVPAHDLHLFAKWEVNSSLWEYQLRENRISIIGFMGTPTKLEIPSKIDNKTVSRIESEAFLNYTSLVTLYIPATVTYIGSSAFKGCSSLVDVTLSSNLGEIAPYLFSGCKKLMKIVIPDNTVKIGNNAFSGCQNLEQIKFSSSLIEIGENAFRNCNKLESITLPISIESINNDAFRDCSDLGDISVPDKIIDYKSDVFVNTLWLSEQPDGLVYLGKMLFGYKGILSEQISIQEGTLGIVSYALYNSSTLKSVMIPDSLTFIGDYAFAEGEQLQFILLNNVTHLGSYAFKNCISLTSIIIPNGTREIGEDPFTGCDDLIIYTNPDNVDRLLGLLNNDSRVRSL